MKRAFSTSRRGGGIKPQKPRGSQPDFLVGSNPTTKLFQVSVGCLFECGGKTYRQEGRDGIRQVKSGGKGRWRYASPKPTEISFSNRATVKIISDRPIKLVGEEISFSGMWIGGIFSCPSGSFLRINSGIAIQVFPSGEAWVFANPENIQETPFTDDEQVTTVDYNPEFINPEESAEAPEIPFTRVLVGLIFCYYGIYYRKANEREAIEVRRGEKGYWEYSGPGRLSFVDSVRVSGVDCSDQELKLLKKGHDLSMVKNLLSLQQQSR